MTWVVLKSLVVVAVALCVSLGGSTTSLMVKASPTITGRLVATPTKPKATAPQADPQAHQRVVRLRRLLVAIKSVENPHDVMYGDNGRALGPLQIHRIAWEDSRVPGSYRQCLGLQYSTAVAINYWSRYCPRALQEVNEEILSRTWNGGPRGMEKASTKKYWQRVASAMSGI